MKQIMLFKALDFSTNSASEEQIFFVTISNIGAENDVQRFSEGAARIEALFVCRWLLVCKKFL